MTLITDSESIGVCESSYTPEEERRIVTELNNEAEADLKEGNLYFVISNRWYTRWQRFVGLLTEEFRSGEPSEVTRPGPIDNHDIIDSESDASDPQLRMMLEEGVDYTLVQQEVWRKLVKWYKGGPPVPRKLISQGFYTKSFSVEVYLLCLTLTDSRDESTTIIRLSKQASIGQLYEMVCAGKGVAKEKARIWDYFEKKKSVLLDPSSEQSVEEAGLQFNQDILLEVDGSASSQFVMSLAENELAMVPLEPMRSDAMDIVRGGGTLSNGHSNGFKFSFFGRNTFKDDVSSRTFGKGEKRGLGGLQNLGNTCFMNSTLQCLAHTPPIVEYFLQDYRSDINAKNPLGMRGELAIAFGELLRKLWSSGQNTVAPRAFKTKLARFAPQFSGYNQHDSQEMLAFLLDGLHEDLNKVKRKPYIEAKDSDGRPDDEVAEEKWKYHKARNDSVIVDVFQGQYKSTLVCPDCGKISITFDPFMYLSLPLPSSRTRSMTVTVFYGDGSHLPMPYTVTVPKDGSCRDLSNALGTACCLDNDESLLLAEVYDHKVFKYYENPRELLNGIKDNEHIVAYRFKQMHKGPGKVKLEILHGEQEKSSDRGPKCFGTPLVTYINKEPLSGTDIATSISGLLSPLRRVHMSCVVNSGNENGHVPDESSRSILSRDTETEDNDRELSLSLLRDYYSFNLQPLESDSVVNPGSVTKVLVKWNEKEHEKYDSSYLNDLPKVHKNVLAKKTMQEGISLFSCLEAFLAEEPLGPDDMWYCPGCKEHRQANKKLDLWKLPDILVFHLKRFTYSRYFKNKIDTLVNFHIHDLDLSKYVKNEDGQSYLYELYAISNHYGGLGGGHYTAYAKLMDETKWYNFDDSRVSAVNESEIKTSAAYVLFYQRVKSDSETSDMKMD
ncbi:ubiquitin-specific protease 11 [Arabidopsis thaliana]|uniref:Putative ubiquitin carboxyl-terminal hydrolase 11 n=1 Tax=Arabidopsis thaliana TaxID=3702 RepID=UBP11_ARATH|nr:ubiquitin-specific protease 11 [Arabidopsis thaliana]Q9MAQ3.2 RecName: Full=Putative ubiquitin carboxyl-terminal hydrolase 11; AltName: Full=Deubiquitinating enzyme 11; Short=AtUBP11; AltName: Full=Ubiquitin thioesterase 11; AltName: Full=Ubiquitin-specific-processing protease 11 [Arabidopsis thaliana]AEE31532.1 ubiquitin-specific protease 11 [Arabidopsis thaliana]|eukprot:NP_174562.2 ubiquitin-specific protease 11 [Arabidopsis thaliana]